MTFSSNGGGTFSANPVTTDSNGLALVNYTTGTKGGTIQILGTVSGFPSATFYEYVIPGAPTAVTNVREMRSPPRQARCWPSHWW